MTVVWADRHTSMWEFTHLRALCPCANCDAGRGRIGRDETVGVRSAAEVGRYALRFEWSDGHDTGIYSFEYLRHHCPCEECQHLSKETSS